MDTKKNWPLIVSAALPILMIIFVAASIYLPGLFTHPNYNFLYTNETRYCGGFSSGASYYYQVNNGIIQEYKNTPVNQGRPAPPPYKSINPECARPPKLFVHDMTKNESREISLEQAKKLKLDNSIQSPDGFEITRGSGSSGLFGLFGESNYNKIFLKGHGTSTKLNLKTSGGLEEYNYSFKFIGWIIK